MGNFCTKCGRPLADGEVCNCQATPQINPGQVAPMPQAAPAPQGQPQMAPQGQPYMQQKAPSQFDAVMKDTLAAFVDIMKAPVTKGQELVKGEKFIVSVIYIVLQALLSTIFATLATVKFMGDGAEATTYVKVFFGTFFGSVLFSAMLFGVVMAANAICKNPISVKSALCVVGNRSIVLCPVILLSVILVLIASSWGIGLFFLASLWGFIVLIKSNPIANPQSEDLLTHIFAAGIFIFVVIAMVIVPRFYIETYFPGVLDTIKGVSNSIKSYSGLLGM